MSERAIEMQILKIPLACEQMHMEHFKCMGHFSKNPEKGHREHCIVSTKYKTSYIWYIFTCRLLSQSTTHILFITQFFLALVYRMGYISKLWQTWHVSDQNLCNFLFSFQLLCPETSISTASKHHSRDNPPNNPKLHKKVERCLLNFALEDCSRL